MYYVFCKYMFEGGYFMWIDAYIPQPVLISPSANFNHNTSYKPVPYLR